MVIEPVAVFSSPLPSKFGIPRQAGLAPSLRGRVCLMPAYHDPSWLRGLDGFDYIWLIWEFSLNPKASSSPTVRPPRLGGNASVGTFASRSPFRPNPLGLTSAKVEGFGTDASGAPFIEVSGADLADGTPIFDIKPYITEYDSHTGIRCGYVDTAAWEGLEVAFSPQAEAALDPQRKAVLAELLALDPRPRYLDAPERVYGMPFDGSDVKFSVCGGILMVLSLDKL